MQNRVYSMLGIAAKSGNVASGEFSAEQAVKSGKAYLVIVSEEASANTKKKFSDMCTYYHVPFEVYGTKDELGRCIGKQFRASLAIVDARLADAVREKLPGKTE